MLLNSTQLQQSSIIWILVADGSQGQVYRYHKNKKIMPTYEQREQHELTVVPGMHVTAASANDFHVEHDDRGTFIGGTSSAHNTCEPHLDVRDEIKQSLVVEIATKLKRASLDHSFDYLLIAAAPEILGALRQHMDAGIRSQVIAEVPKDFTHDTTAKLLEHVEKVFLEDRAA